ncbi:MAG: 6-phosphogluconate dehydrogenase [Parcubacteria group bacterium Greene0416_79]|nr:MAG: 6-phosphogluconate dehydrogenase [Parcubacteria group bacterium Greene0416_79]
MRIGYIGLGKMGLAMVARLLEKSWQVVSWNRSPKPLREAKKAGAAVNHTLEGVCKKMKAPRLIWLMVSQGAVDEVLAELVLHLSRGDTVIDGGNSFYKDSMRRANALAKKGIHFLDAGVSGGPFGARKGACLMIGGDKKVFKKYEKLFLDLSACRKVSITLRYTHTDKLENVGMSSFGGAGGSYAYVGKSGAGHFVKMVHNGIEYGMMQAIAEGFTLLRSADERGLTETRMNADTEDADRRGYTGTRIHADKKRVGFGFDLRAIAELYNQGSVIESRLMGWLAKAFKEHGEGLTSISGDVSHSGEGLWTVLTAKELGVPVKVIEDALTFRVNSTGNPSYTGQVVSALRNQFGRHEVTNDQRPTTNH